MQQDGKQNESAVVRCSSCGAEMLFDPSKGKLSCPYCGSERAIERRVAVLRDVLLEQDEGAVVEDEDVYRCPNCGGEVDFHGLDTAKKCPFCGAVNAVKLQDIKGIKPDSILPFLVPVSRATELFKKWAKNKVLAPNAFRKMTSAQDFSGTYVPGFAFNSNTFSSYDGKFGKYKTRTVGAGSNRHVETYTDWYYVRGDHAMPFENVMVEASEKLTSKEFAKILPYDVASAEAYTREYLAGFSAQRYDTPLANCFGVAKDKMTDAIKNAIINKYQPDVVGYLEVHTNFNDNLFRYIMLPLWICAATYKGKIYRFLVNGRTGKSYGKAPVSPAKASGVAFAVLLTVGGIIALALHLAGIF